MQVVCEATQNSSIEVQVAAFECLVRIMGLYYDKMNFYMERALFGVSCSQLHFVGLELNTDIIFCEAYYSGNAKLGREGGSSSCRVLVYSVRGRSRARCRGC